MPALTFSSLLLSSFCLLFNLLLFPSFSVFFFSFLLLSPIFDLTSSPLLVLRSSCPLLSFVQLLPLLWSVVNRRPESCEHTLLSFVALIVPPQFMLTTICLSHHSMCNLCSHRFHTACSDVEDGLCHYCAPLALRGGQVRVQWEWCAVDKVYIGNGV